ncbi:TRPM8 channel-associated factor homolog [Ambystoma mexicanum]|uniref:TRPM8 channel-associated factor homolog n=1 Tax=Ambystoma mexicanum TaxID=8296 RepID=UPI0037E9C191
MGLRAAYKALTQGIDVLDFTGTSVPCDLLLIGDHSFPVLISSSGQVLIAASHYGKGRVVAIAHEIYLYRPEFYSFLQNVIQWLKPSADALVGVHSTLEHLVKTFSVEGTTVQSSQRLLDSFGVFCMDAYDASQKSELIAFVKNGGGLLIGGQAWNWSYKHGAEKVCSEFPGNQVISVSGIYFTSNYGERGIFSVSTDIPICPLLVRHGIDFSKDLKLLLAGVTDLDIKNEGTPSHLLVHGALAFPVGLDDSHNTFLAAGYYGQGRVVVATHEQQLDTPLLKTFLLNAVSWLDAGRRGKIGVASSLKAFQNLLTQNNVPCGTSDLISSLSVYCCTSYSDREAQKIHEFVAEGGGLLIGGQAWWWASQNPGQDAVSQYPGNKILNKFGISILGYSFKADKYKPVRPEDGHLHYHFRRAVDRFLKDINGKGDPKATPSAWLKRLGDDCAEFAKLPAEDSAVISSVHRLLKNLLCSVGIPKCSKEKPIKNHSIESVLMKMATSLYNTHPDLAHVTLTIDANNQGSTAWRSTGQYLYPGQSATLGFPPAAVGACLQVQIGCQSDDLSKLEELSRPPVVIKVCPVNSKRMTVSSLHGGLIYILVPGGCQLGNVPVTIGGAVHAPFFKHGETSENAWLETIRHYPAPWAEFATQNIILTVPTDSARLVENPTALMALWDQVMKAIAELAAIPAHFSRPERVVADTQISAGWMHSGYPIMVHVQSVPDLLDLKHIKSACPWGIFHELGHNQQCSGWDIKPNTTEATCNLWSVYVSEQVLGIPRDKAHESLQSKVRREAVKTYIRNGAKLEDWTVWTALETYLQLQEGFGWGPFIQLFSDYQKIKDVPSENEGKMKLWAEKFSIQVQKNLVPFFKAWGWPIHEDTAAKLSSLPEWKENPMTNAV